MEASAAVSPEAAAAIGRLADSLPPGQPAALNPSDPGHWEAIDAALRAADRSPDRYPGLHAALTTAGGAPDGAVVVDQGVDKDGRATAMAWLAAANEPLYAGGSLFVLDGNNALLAVGHNSNVGEGFVPISTDSAGAAPAPPGGVLKTVSIGHSVAADGTVQFTALTSTAAVDDNGADIKVLEPTRYPKTPPNVIIALGRDSEHSNPDADYIYTEPYNLATPWLIVPFSGYAELPYPIVGTPGQPIADAVVSSTIFYVVGGKTLIVQLDPNYTPASKLANGIIAADPYTVEFNFPADGNSYDTTSSLVYGQQSQTNETISYFLITLQIPVDSPQGFFTFSVCSTDTPNKPSGQCEPVPNLMFWWHCVAEGTEITLADGSTAPIETLTNRHRVATGKGGSLGVEATARGAHDPSDNGVDAVYRLTTEGGRSLVATGKHAISTPGGLVALGDLAVGDEVDTDRGADRIASLEPAADSGVFYNLKLGDESDRAEGLHDAQTIATYVAGGIVVGDHLAMNLHHRQRARDVEYMSSRVPAAFAADYASAVADIRY